jgi:hypothetical protein
MISKLIDILFGCWHSHTSFPISAKKGARRCGAAAATGTYVVCLDCGKEFAYDWSEMKVVGPAERERPTAVPSLAPKEAA